MNIRGLRNLAIKLGATIDDDKGCGEITAEALPGRRWEEGLHELVSCYVCFHPSEYPAKELARLRKNAINDMAERMTDTGPTEKCDDPDCDWCGGV